MRAVNFDDLKLRTKTLIPLVIMAVVFACLIAGATFRMNDLVRRYSKITDGVDPATLQLSRSSRIANELGHDVYENLIYDHKDPRANIASKAFADITARGDRTYEEAIRLNPEKADQYRAFEARFDAITAMAEAPMAIGDSGPGLALGSKLAPKDLDQMAQAAKEMADVDSGVNALNADVQTFNHSLEAENAKALAALRRDAATTVSLIIGVGLATIVIGLAIGAWIGNGRIAAPLVRLGERMKRLANGDLDIDIEGQSRADEVGAMAKAVQVFKDNALKSRSMEAETRSMREAAEAQRETAQREQAARAAELARVVQALAGGLQKLSDGVLTYRLDQAFADDYEALRRDFNDAIDKMEAALGAVVAATHGIHAGSGEITQAADDLSRRTEQQAASLEQTAAALDQITATVRRTAEGALHARAVVGKAKDDAQASSEIVEGAVKAMSAIEQSSSQIGQIIGVIDEIAFQTNLLALNAGVEAARAGDAGRGFAVVAQEVRALAQRSAQAAKEIKALISASAHEVGHGVDLVGRTGAALQRIASQIAEISAVVDEIAHSAQEQATGLGQVNSAVNQMDQMTQQNAAMVEESTAASHGMAQEAANLAKLTGGFEVGAPPSQAKRAIPGRPLARSA
jgi:methyl-accepting chemotaxis protein